MRNDWQSAVTDVRLARPTARLDEQEKFYDAQARLPRIAAFRDHDGYSGTIWRLGDRGPQFELCAGPGEPSAGAGWALELPGGTDSGQEPARSEADPEGYAWRTRPETLAPTGIRPVRRVRECQDFYSGVLGLYVQSAAGSLTVALPSGRGLIRLDPDADAPAATVEDMLVFYFADRAVRDQLARRLLEAGASPVSPHNPYWIPLTRCVTDPEGLVVALAVDP